MVAARAEAARPRDPKREPDRTAAAPRAANPHPAARGGSELVRRRAQYRRRVLVLVLWLVLMHVLVWRPMLWLAQLERALGKVRA